MFLLALCGVFLVTSPALTAVVQDNEDFCSANEFACGDGACVSLDHYCDGKNDCADATDEISCHGVTDLQKLRYGNVILNRNKRQATSNCRANQWRCRDGTCIGFDGKCDGVADCPDGSDETHALCRNTPCQNNWFRCMYGACTDGTAPCNGIKECVDNSDELLPRCRNETLIINGKFKCANGQLTSGVSICDGVKDCSDGSDESVRVCAGQPCPSHLFQCAYGACVDKGSDCNGKEECADGSDESDELCNRIGTATTAKPQPQPAGGCVLPSYPQHGSYRVTGAPNASPGQSFFSLNLNVTCNPGYGILGTSSLFCIGGSWSGDLPECVRFCKLNKHESVEYRCLISRENSVEGTRPCEDFEPTGTVVRPICRAPNYYFSGVLSSMRCLDGSWDSVAICTPGLAKNGTKITIIVKEKVEVHVNEFQYAAPYGQVTPVTPNSFDYDIDEKDWRIRKPDKVKGVVNFYIKNSSLFVPSPDKIYFRD